MRKVLVSINLATIEGVPITGVVLIDPVRFTVSHDIQDINGHIHGHNKMTEVDSFTIRDSANSFVSVSFVER